VAAGIPARGREELQRWYGLRRDLRNGMTGVLTAVAASF